MIQRAYRRIMDEREWMPVALLLALGFALRLIALGSVPFGLNQDEASAGYEAFALLNGGVDRCGSSWPVLFISWGSGQNVLMSYLAMPFVALMGLTETAIRLPNALSGCATLVVFWLTARRARGKDFALMALLLLTVNPWHIMMSRWALESNLLPFFLSLGLCFCTFAREKPWALLGAAVSFGLMLYAYGTAFFFLPFFLVAAVMWLRRDIEGRSFCAALTAFVLIALPLALCQLRNMLGLEGISFLGISLPRLTQGRQMATSVFGGGGFSAAADNFMGLLNILVYQQDGLSYNSMPFWKGGLFYFFGLPTAVAGLASYFVRRSERDRETPFVIVLAAALICGLLIRCNINRINMIWLPLIYFSAAGCHVIACKIRSWTAAELGVIFLCFVLFWNSYAAGFREPGNVNYFPGLGSAIRYAEELEAESIYITDYVNSPYIFALFYSEADPEEFRSSVVYADENAAFRPVESFGAYSFTARGKADADILILHRSQVDDSEVLACFGSYAVCAGE